MKKYCATGMGLILGAFVLTVLPPICLAEDLVPDVAAVEGMERYQGPEAGKELLAKNGFVVTPRFYHRIFGPYLQKSLPHYITADSVHRTFHVLFEEHLKELEKVSEGDVLAVVAAMCAGLETLPSDSVAGGALAGPAAQAQALAINFFRVAEMLLSAEEVDGDCPAKVASELELIRAAGGIGPSPLFGRLMDYSQFEPRGFYAELPALRRYFRTMAWFGNAAFLLNSERDTLAALMIAKVLQDTPSARARWQKLDRIYTHFLAPCDDLTPKEIGAALPTLGTLDSSAALKSVMGVLRTELRDPAISSMPLTPGQTEDWIAHTKGMRFFGKRYIPDSEIFMNLTDPNVAGRGFPTGLDIMAANGSARAAALMAETPIGKRPDYIAGAKKATELLDSIKANGTSQYARFLRVAETLTAPPVAEAAPFAKTEAYADKNLMTSLAAWASMRHAWVLHAKQSLIYAGEGPPDPPAGYVEPNPAFFQAMGVLAGQTRALFESSGVADVERFMAYETLVGELSEMVRKELAGEAFSSEEERLFVEFGYTIARLQGFEFNDNSEAGCPWMCLVADVHSEGLSGQCLEVATGGAMPIYVAMEHEGTPFLLIGGVYSYYEFAQPIADRLTDEAWRAKWDRGNVPAMPTWTRSFVSSEYDSDAVIARLRKGEKVAGLEFIRDPALDAFLIDNVGLEKELLPEPGYLYNAASLRAPEKVNPILIAMLRDSDIPSIHSIGPQPDPRLFFAFYASEGLAGNVRKEDLPALHEILKTSDSARANWVLRTLEGTKEKYVEGFLMSSLRDCGDVYVKKEILDWVGWKASKDVTPALLELWRGEQGAIKMKCLLTLRAIGAPQEPGLYASTRIPSKATARELKHWEAQVTEAFQETIDAFDWVDYPAKQRLRQERREGLSARVRETREKNGGFDENLWSETLLAVLDVRTLQHLVEAVGDLQLASAVPFLDRAMHHIDERAMSSVVDSLMKIGTDEAIDVLSQAVGHEEGESALQQAFVSLHRSPDPAWARKTIGIHARLLENKSVLPDNGARVCDVLVGSLAEYEQMETPGYAASDRLADRDAKAREWIDYIRGLAVR